MAAGPGRNVGQAYARFAQALEAGVAGPPNFNDAIIRHTLIDAMERSHAEGKVIRLS
jgi:predicted dehydrogenase